MPSAKRERQRANKARGSVTIVVDEPPSITAHRLSWYDRLRARWASFALERLG